MARLTFEVAHESCNTNALPWFHVMAMLLEPCNLIHNKCSRVEWIDATLGDVDCCSSTRDPSLFVFVFVNLIDGRSIGG